MTGRLFTHRRARVAVVATALFVVACSDPPAPPPRAADWPAPLVQVPPPPAPPLWGDDLVALVATPEGHLGPRTEVAVDPRLVDGVSWTGSRWEMNRDWDELTDGGYLDFGAAPLDVGGHTLLGFRIEVPEGLDGGHVIDGGGEVGWFEITNPRRHPVNSYLRLVDVAHHYLALGVAGDAIKVGQGHTAHSDAFISMDVLPGDSTGKHYDGAQVFKTGSLDLRRVVIDWNEAGTVASTTGALFTQDSAALTARDITVLDPGGTWQPIRLSGTGHHDVDRVHVSGERRPNVAQPDREAPTALVKLTNGMSRFTLHNDVPGTEDWLVDAP